MDRATVKQLIEQEGYWSVDNIENVTIDKKNWYIRFFCSKVPE